MAIVPVVIPRGHVNRRDGYIAVDYGNVIEPGTVNSVDQICRIVVIRIVAFRKSVVRILEHGKFAGVCAFITVIVAGHVTFGVYAVELNSISFCVSFCQYGFDGCLACGNLGLYGGILTAFGRCYGCTVMYAVHVVIVYFCR